MSHGQPKSGDILEAGQGAESTQLKQHVTMFLTLHRTWTNHWEGPNIDIALKNRTEARGLG